MWHNETLFYIYIATAFWTTEQKQPMEEKYGQVYVCACIFWLCLNKRVPNFKQVSNLVWLVRSMLKHLVNLGT